MENKIKRFLSLLLALVMVIGMMPVGHAHAAATAPVSGKTYVIVNTRAGKILTNTEVNDKNGLLLDGTVANIANPTVWTIKQSESGYTIQDSNDKYLSIDNNDANLQDEPATINIGLNGDTWTISQNGAYLNQHGGGTSTRAAGWQDASAAGDDGSQWKLYEYVSLDLNETRTVTFDGEVTVAGHEGDAIVSVNSEVKPLMTGTYMEDVTTNETLTNGKYVLLNTRTPKYLQSTSADGKLYMDTIALDFAEKWLITADGDGYTMQASNGQYLTISGSGNDSTSGLTDEKTIVSFTWKEGAWQVGCNGTYLNDFRNGKAGGYNVDGDGGSQWKLYKEVDAPAYTWTLGDQVTEPGQIENGGYYIFENNSASGAGTNLLSGDWSNTNAGGGGSGYGLKLFWNKNHITENNIWKITGTAGNYNVQHLNGWNLFIASGKAVRTPDRSATVIGQDSSNHADKWQISVGGIHLNRWGGATVQVAGWGDVNDNNSQWNIYKVIPTAQYITEITFTAKAAGYSTTITAGDVNYIVHVHGYNENVVTAPGCETAGEKNYVCVCGKIDRTEEIPATGHVNTHIEDAKKPTLCEPGHTGKTVCENGHIVSEGEEITQLPVATVLNGNKLVALSDCEYTFNQNDNSISFTRTIGDTIYYVMPASFRTNGTGSPGGQAPQNTTTTADGVWNGLVLHWNTDDGSVQFSGNGSIHFFHNKDLPYWDRCSTYPENTGTVNDAAGHNLYIFAPGGNSEIPGYHQITSAEGLKNQESYLIAAKKTANNVDTWYVMHPSASTNAYDHIAEVKSELHTIGHKAGNPVEENRTDASYDLVTRCVYCNEVMATETVYTQIVVESLNVRLPAEIELEYTVSIPDAIVEAGAYVVLTKAGGYGNTVEKEFRNLQDCWNEEKKAYEFAIGIASGEMTCPVTIEVRDAKGNAMNLNTKKRSVGTSVTKTVEDYVELVLNNENNTEAKKTLAKALLVYGGYAQTNFGIEAAAPNYDALGISTDLNVTLADLENYKNSQTADAKVRATGITAFLDSYIFVRVYLTVDGDIGNYAFTLTTPNSTVVLTPVWDGNRYYVDIPEIASGYIDNTYTITVTDTNGVVDNVITTSVLSYARTVLKNAEKNSEAKMNLAKALYLYNQAADAFFVQNNNANS